MKARIRKTGEIVDVIAYNHCSTIRSSQDHVSYIDSDGVEHDRESLNYYWDFESIFIEEDTTDNKHWQYLRERAAIAAMQGLLTNPSRAGSFKDYAEGAVACADSLIEKLKKNNGHN